MKLLIHLRWVVLFLILLSFGVGYLLGDVQTVEERYDGCRDLVTELELCERDLRMCLLSYYNKKT